MPAELVKFCEVSLPQDSQKTSAENFVVKVTKAHPTEELRDRTSEFSHQDRTWVLMESREN